MAEIAGPPDGPHQILSAPELLTEAHHLAGFDCGDAVLNDWLQQRALKNQSRFSRTYVVCQAAQVVGFFWISAGAVERLSAPGKIRRNAPDSVPVAIIGRLAVDRHFTGKGLGADMLADALRRIAVAAQTIGMAAVLVHAKDDAAKRFYLRCAELMEYPQDSRTLFLLIETIIAAFD